ncbi:aminotransferase class IV [Candidatus Contubernalis alkaliaceticus]|uniref:aminotransferase class IV n=1 Tax=Candidatus Contubernalis alkaliaceticus TaxID=338645 RepID=UPI001F4C0B5D|nr:aminotransferase class IV [Candidatus Contubernalis alkalaceticus]UNC92385.1 aminotransferase class IV [Candidatus Contubernalis alkalaceticus]
MEGICYFNGNYINSEEVMISASDRGFLYGDGLFETLRVYQGKVFLAEQHLTRLFRASSLLQIPIDKDMKKYDEIFKKVIRMNQLGEGFLRLSLSRGVGKRGLLPQDSTNSVVIVVPNFTIPYSEETYLKGFTAVIINNTRRNPFSPLSKLKTLNYLDNIIAKMEAEERKAEEGLLLNVFGNLSGGTVSNLFIIKNRILFTPTLNCGILNGITRQRVIELAARKNIEIKEKSLNPNRLFDAQEAFLTNSLMEIMPLVQVDGNLVGNGEPGPIARLLRSEYKKSIVNLRSV